MARIELPIMAAVCGQASAWPGSKVPGSPTPHTVATLSRRKDDGGGFTLKPGASCRLIRSPSGTPRKRQLHTKPLARPVRNQQNPAQPPADHLDDGQAKAGTLRVRIAVEAVAQPSQHGFADAGAFVQHL